MVGPWNNCTYKIKKVLINSKGEIIEEELIERPVGPIKRAEIKEGVTNIGGRSICWK